MPPRTTTWPLEQHTRGKHMVLKNYMGAWLPILTSWSGLESCSSTPSLGRVSILEARRDHRS